jgi:hypothetical protein
VKSQGYPNVPTHSRLKIIIQLRKVHEVTSFPTMSFKGKYPTTFRPMKKSSNSPESMREAITVIEIICSEPMMHMDTCPKVLEHTLDIFNECCTFPT